MISKICDLMVGQECRYISTMPSFPFALDEAKTIAGLMTEYNGRDDIRSVVHEGNLLNVKGISNESKQFNYIFNRLSVTPESVRSIILDGDVVDSKYANLITNFPIYDI